MSEKIYSMITDRISQLLEAGTVPWRKPWTTAEGNEPQNAISGKTYRGINLWTLGSAGFADHRFLTFKQAQEMGGSVRKGEHGFPVIFWNITNKVIDGQERKLFLLRYYTVFNVSQCDGLAKLPALVTSPGAPAREPLAKAESILSDYFASNGAPNLTHGGARAFYMPALDRVQLPERASFPKLEEYYSTAFHEMGHSTGIAERCGRGLDETKGVTFGDHEYSKEELVAEFCASYLCGVSGIEAATLGNSAAYIASWLRKLKDNPKWLVTAASAAQRAATFILDSAHEETSDEPTSAEDESAVALAAV